MTPFSITDGSASKSDFLIPTEDVYIEKVYQLDSPNFESDKHIDLKEDPENKIQKEIEDKHVSFSRNCNFEFLLISL